MLTSQPFVQTKDRNINQLQNYIVKNINALISNALVSGVFLNEQAIVEGSNTINHKLGRVLIGWYPVRIRAYVETRGNVTNGSAVITTIPSTTNLNAGDEIISSLFASGTTISTVDSSTQVTASANATGATTAAANIVFRHQEISLTDYQDFNSTPEKTLTIYSNASASVDFYVF